MLKKNFSFGGNTFLSDTFFILCFFFFYRDDSSFVWKGKTYDIYGVYLIKILTNCERCFQ